MDENRPPGSNREFEREEIALKEKILGETARIQEWERKEIESIQQRLKNSIIILSPQLPPQEIEEIKKRASRDIIQARELAKQKLQAVLKRLNQDIEKLKKKYNISNTSQQKENKIIQTMHTKKAEHFNDPDANEKIAIELGWPLPKKH